MKSYLSLIPISARVRKKQSRMILICITLAVFLVTAIFSLAEAGFAMQTRDHIDVAGYWHIRLSGLSEEEAQQIADRADVAASSWYGLINLDEDLKMDKDYYMDGHQTALCGIEEPFITDIMHYFSEGSHVTGERDVILTENAQTLLGVKVGDTVTLDTPAGSLDFSVSGFRISGDGRYVNANGGQESALLVKEDQVGAFMSIRTFSAICSAAREACDPQYYIQFKEHTKLKKAIDEIQAQYGLTDEDIKFNTLLMASKGISNNTYIQNIYPLAGLLFLMILVAGVLMITSSMNSNVAQRMQFFGMLRCLGASKRQIICFVRLEALYWCRIAVLVGVLLGMAVTWGLSAGLKYIVGAEFAYMPVFTLSWVGILCGVVIGVVTVFLAAQAPAKRAAQASPMAAVSGAAGDIGQVKRRADTRALKIETALGIHHAASSKKNLFLMTGSFAFSIILFLCFSVLIDLVDCLLPQKSASPDMDITSVDEDENVVNDIDVSFADTISKIEGVAHVLGRRVCFDFPAEIPEAEDSSVLSPENVDLISYDDYQLNLLVKDDDLRKGSDIEKVKGDSPYVLAIWDRDMPLKIEDKIRIGERELMIAGMLKYNPFSNDGSTGGKMTIIVSNETFIGLTGITGYAILDVQMEKGDAGMRDRAVGQIRELSETEAYVFRDRGDEDTRKEFYVFIVFAYGFIAIIAMITLLNIMNSISMSVSARIGQYGAMRAVGMSAGQLTRMIAAEAFTYAVSGCVIGCTVGLFLSRYMYDHLITSHFYYFTWQVPVGQLIIVFVFIFVTVTIAVYAPSKRIRDMTVTDVISGS